MPSPAHLALAERLRAALKAAHMSQAALAGQLGVSQQTVSKWLTAETAPRLKLLPRLAQVLDIDPAELSAALVAADTPLTADQATELRVAALDRRIRSLSPEQLSRLEDYVRGLRDGSM